MPTLIANLWSPAIWVEAMRERQATFPGLFASKAVQNLPLLDQVASGAGTSANIPYFKDITDQADEIQVENTAPTTDNIQDGSTQVCTILNRVTKNSVGALAAQVAGADPVAATIDQLLQRRLKQRQTTLVAILRALFGTASGIAINAACSMSAVRLGGTTAENAQETGLSASASQKVSPDMFINTVALLGELAGTLAGGVFMCHPQIKAALQILDAANFKTIQRPSDLPFDLVTYRDVPIIVSNALRRVGTTNGFVYDNYILAQGVVGYGSKPQQGDTIDVASLSYFQDKDKNNEIIYDRTRFVLHINGLKWVGVPAGQSATNAELQTIANWTLQLQSADRVGVACFRCNG